MAALTKEMVPMVVGGGASARVESDMPAKFTAGDRVVVKNINPFRKLTGRSCDWHDH